MSIFSRAHHVIEIRKTGERVRLGGEWGAQDDASRYARLLALTNPDQAVAEYAVSDQRKIVFRTPTASG